MTLAPRIRALACLLPLLLVSGCDNSVGVGEGPSGLGTTGFGTGRFLLHDATADELLSFSVEVDGVSVVYDDDTVSDNLVTAPFRVELLSLGEFSKWMAQSEFGIGTVRAIEISFTPFSYRARALDGTDIQVDALADFYVAPLAEDEVVERDDVVTFVSSLDLQGSLVGDVSDGMIMFDPEGVSRAAAPGELLPVDRFIGLVQLRDTGTLDLVVEAFADDERTSSLGPVAIFADVFTLFVDRDLNTLFFPPALFYTILYPALTLVEVHGVLEASGDFIASRIEIEDQDGGAGATYPYKLRGIVSAKTPGVVRLQIQSIPRGAFFIEPILQGLGDPAGTNISLSSQTLAVLLENQELLPSSVLVGDVLDVKFQVFPTEPFPAVVVSIRGVRPGFRGVIADTGGLPSSFLMNLVEFDAGILGGVVESDETDVLVNIDPNLTLIALGTIFKPFLEADDLVTELGLHVTGDLIGASDEPQLDADRILVQPGLLDRGEVTSVDVAGSRLRVAGGEITGSFGGAFLASAVYDVIVESDATLIGEAQGIAELAEALAELEPGERLLVDIQGIGFDMPDGIRAYQVLSFVE